MNIHYKKMKTEWSKNSQKYTDLIGMTGRRPEKSEFAETVRDIKSKFDINCAEVDRVLDVGCNNGYLLKCLQPVARKLVGVDFCREPILQGKIEFKDISFIQAEVNNLPFPDGSFERVICYNMFHYLRSEDSALQAATELFRVLAGGGKLLIGDLFVKEYKHQIPEDDVNRWISAKRPYMHNMKNWLFVSLDSLKSLFSDLNASDITVFGQDGQIRCVGYRFDILIQK